AEDGLPVGILDPLPRTPHVFEEQVKWPLENPCGRRQFLERYGEHTAIAALAVIVEEGETAFSVVGDIAKSHRRYKHKEHGYLACQVDTKEEVPGDPASQTVYVNLVGAFGLSCAGCSSTRIAACGLRLTYHLLGPDFPLDLLLYADDLEAMGKGPRGRRGISLTYLFLATLGYPFKWAKTRRGFRVEWLGMETEYPTYKLGLSLVGRGSAC
ncbi:unnamed protein product, partial [Symbiodinium necroappetens]